MLDYTVGDKVVCIAEEQMDLMRQLEWSLKNFYVAAVGEVFTVRDILPPEAMMYQDYENHFGVQFHEVCAGIDKTGEEWWFDAGLFRKVLPTEQSELTKEDCFIV